MPLVSICVGYVQRNDRPAEEVHSPISGSHDKNTSIHLCSTGDHVLDVISVTGAAGREKKKQQQQIGHVSAGKVCRRRTPHSICVLLPWLYCIVLTNQYDRNDVYRFRIRYGLY